MDRFLPFLLVVPCWIALAGDGVSQAASVAGQVSISGGPQVDLSRAVVYLDARPDLANPPPPDDQRPQIAQHDKAFTPNLLVITQGTTVEFPNWDPFSHNVFSRSRAASFDLERYEQGQSKSYAFNSVGVVQVFCNIHPQMRAVLVVVPNRHFVRADGQGRFLLNDVPHGPHTLVVWHERGGEQRQSIHVPVDGLRDVGLAMTVQQARERTPSASVKRRAPPGAERGLGVKRERLNLPIVGGAHPAPKTGGKR
jgi:plastocyanin